MNPERRNENLTSRAFVHKSIQPVSATKWSRNPTWMIIWRKLRNIIINIGYYWLLGHKEYTTGRQTVIQTNFPWNSWCLLSMVHLNWHPIKGLINVNNQLFSHNTTHWKFALISQPTKNIITFAGFFYGNTLC